MTHNSWDPLLQSKEADSEILASAQKREIKNILKSYVGMYDCFSELIQNAMDAVDKKAHSSDEHEFKPHLKLCINLKEQWFSILDNGVGFKEKELQSFLAPNISFKQGSKSRGNKGVGATYIAYGFNKLDFGTKSPTYSFNGTLQDGRLWVDDELGVVTRPVVQGRNENIPELNKIQQGSYFRLYFGGDNTRPKCLNWYMASTAEQWLFLLLIRTPLGMTVWPNEDSNITFDLSVIDKNGEITEITSQKTQYIYPHTKIKASTDLSEVIEYQSKLVSNGHDASKLPIKYTKANGLFEFFESCDLEEIAKRKPEIVEIIKKYKVKAYGYFSHSTSVWDQFNDSLAKLRKGYRVLKGGLQLANNGMIQGDLLVIPLTSNTGYQNQCHIVVQFLGADPDLGRKGFQPELKEAAEEIAVHIVNRFKKWRHLLKSDSGTKPDITKEIELHEWIKLQEEHEKNHPLLLTNKNYFAPLHEISITSTPQSEQDVIVLFNQLIAGGVIRGLKLLSTSQQKQYDGIFKFEVKDPIDNHFFNKESNPLGVEEFQHQKAILSPPKILEYKYSIDALIEEFESETKFEKDIHLAVAWELGENWKKNYEATSLLDLDNYHLRPYHGLTHILDSGTTKFYLVILEELLEYLNDVEGSQEYQKNKYSNSIF